MAQAYTLSSLVQYITFRYVNNQDVSSLNNVTKYNVARAIHCGHCVI